VLTKFRGQTPSGASIVIAGFAAFLQSLADNFLRLQSESGYVSKPRFGVQIPRDRKAPMRGPDTLICIAVFFRSKQM